MMVATNMNSKEIFDFDEHLLYILRLASVKFLLLFSDVPVYLHEKLYVHCELVRII